MSEETRIPISDSHTMAFDINKIKPDPEKVAASKQVKMVIFSVIGCTLGAYFGYNSPKMFADKIDHKILAGAGGILGFIGGIVYGNRKTHEEQVYDLINDASKDPANFERNVQVAMVKKISDLEKRAASESAAIY